jgi:dihydrofolate reductase
MKIIAACCKNLGIGMGNKIPWHIPEEFKYLKKMTSHGINPTVVMGRNTWESLPKKPLKNRKNIIISNSLYHKDVIKYDNTFVTNDISKIHNLTKKKDPVWILGGEKIYYQFIDRADEIYLTFIDRNYPCDTFFPVIPNDFNLKYVSNIQHHQNIQYNYQIWDKNYLGKALRFNYPHDINKIL